MAGEKGITNRWSKLCVVKKESRIGGAEREREREREEREREGKGEGGSDGER